MKKQNREKILEKEDWIFVFCFVVGLFLGFSQERWYHLILPIFFFIIGIVIGNQIFKRK